MKVRLLFFVLSFLYGMRLFGQSTIEAQLGGSNFIGSTINAAFTIPISEAHDNRLCPSFGIGMLAPGWDVPTTIFHAGMNYLFKSWGAGRIV
jgi:hypothetical protein